MPAVYSPGVPSTAFDDISIQFGHTQFSADPNTFATDRTLRATFGPSAGDRPLDRRRRTAYEWCDRLCRNQ